MTGGEEITTTLIDALLWLVTNCGTAQPGKRTLGTRKGEWVDVIFMPMITGTYIQVKSNNVLVMSFAYYGTYANVQVVTFIFSKRAGIDQRRPPPVPHISPSDHLKNRSQKTAKNGSNQTSLSGSYADRRCPTAWRRA